jgi:hypothetical protein
MAWPCPHPYIHAESLNLGPLTMKNSALSELPYNNNGKKCKIIHAHGQAMKISSKLGTEEKFLERRP